MKAFEVEKKSNGLIDVPGFEACGVACDIRSKNNGQLDLAIIFSAQPCTAGGVFTRNAIKAAPVKLSQKLLQQQKHIHGIITNSGNANACTGQKGYQNAISMQKLAANAFRVPTDSFFVCSTGKIGITLPITKIRKGVKGIRSLANSSAIQGKKAARAILTSDTHEKISTVKIPFGKKLITIAGMAKGAGMIEPQMATMLAFIATDAAISKNLLQQILKTAVKDSFNAITVDGDMSTNDTVLALANGNSKLRITPSSTLYNRFTKALCYLCNDLAYKIVSDGEKITKIVEVIVKGAKSQNDAEKIARSIGNSVLVKSSWYGNDPNWGRLLDAIGYAGASIIEEKINLAYQHRHKKSGPISIFKKGVPSLRNKAKWKQIVGERQFSILLDLNLGKGSYRLLSTDLTDKYVNFNKSE